MPLPESAGGWGNGLPISLSDMLLVRQAIREDWPVAQPVRNAVVRDLTEVALSSDLSSDRYLVAAVKVFIAMEGANQDAEFAARRLRG